MTCSKSPFASQYAFYTGTFLHNVTLTGHLKITYSTAGAYVNISGFAYSLFYYSVFQAFSVNSIHFGGVSETNSLEKTRSGHPKRKGHTE